MLRKTAFILVVIILISTIYAPALATDPPVLEGRVVILDAGHGSSTSNIYEGYDEQYTMLKLAYKIKPLLESLGATVHMTRTDHETVLLSKCAALINIWALDAVKDLRIRESDISEKAASDVREINRLIGIMQSIVDEPREKGRVYMNTPFDEKRKIHQDLAKVFEFQKNTVIRDRFLVISLHSNSTPAPIITTVSGATVFYISNSHKNTINYYSGYSYGEQSRRFGETLLDHIDELGIRKRETKVDNFFINREHNVPSVLVENGFHTNARDREKLSDDKFLEKLALAYQSAIVDYYSGFPLPVPPPAPVAAAVLAPESVPEPVIEIVTEPEPEEAAEDPPVAVHIFAWPFNLLKTFIDLISAFT